MATRLAETDHVAGVDPDQRRPYILRGLAWDVITCATGNVTTDNTSFNKTYSHHTQLKVLDQ